MRTIGRYYEVSLNSAMNNTYEFYTEPASVNMDCPTLQAGIERLSGMVDEWIYKRDTSSNSTEQNNASSIVQILQGRLNEYNRIYNAQCLGGSVTPGTITDPSVNYESEAGAGSGTGLLFPLLLLGAGIFFLYKKKNRRGSGSRRKPSKRKR